MGEPRWEALPGGARHGRLVTRGGATRDTNRDVNIAPVEVTEHEGSIVRAAEVTWSDGGYRLEVSAPHGVADRSDDASGFLCAALPLAMLHGGDLTVEGPVSALLASRLDELIVLYSAWERRMRPITVHLSGGVVDGPAPSTKAASTLSRGVDSLFTAARDRHGPRRLDGLIFGDHLEPMHDDAVRAQEIAATIAAADALDLPLFVVDSNVRWLTDSFGTDWEDVLAAGLAFVAHGVSAGFGSFTVPSAEWYGTIDPCGSSPLLDHLYSTERMAIEHDTVAFSRIDKIRWLAAHTPELIGQIKVCASENRSDNCGRCRKCLYTMACLDLAGLLEAAVLFPDEIDTDAVAQLRIPRVISMMDWNDIAEAAGADARHASLQRAARQALQQSALPASFTADRGRRWWGYQTMRDQRLDAVLSLVLSGAAPTRPDPARDLESVLALVTEGDKGAAVVPASALPAGSTALGLVPRLPLPGSVPVWVNAHGDLVTRGMTSPRLGRWSSLRWQLSPLWTGRHVRWRVAARRRAAVRRRVRHADALTTEREPAAYLHRTTAGDRIALYASWHRAGTVQALTTDGAPLDGFGHPVLLGYLDPVPAGG